MTFSSRGVGHLLEHVYATSDPPDTIPRLKTPINTTLFGVHGHVRPKRS